MSELRIPLRGVIYPEDGIWLAHCLEMDIVAEGETPKVALQNVIELCSFQLRIAKKEGDLESAFRPAPPEYWKLFFTAQKRHPMKRWPKRTEPIEKFEARELQFA